MFLPNASNHEGSIAAPSSNIGIHPVGSSQQFHYLSTPPPNKDDNTNKSEDQ